MDNKINHIINQLNEIRLEYAKEYKYIDYLTMTMELLNNYNSELSIDEQKRLY